MRRYRQRVPHPAQYVGATVRALLAERGVRVDRKQVRREKVPEDAHRLAVRYSPPLSVLIRGMGKYSNNYVAEMLLKTIGAETEARGERPATWADGLGSVRQFLTDEVGLAKESFRYGNGSGLFNASGFSPRALVSVLASAYADFRYGPDLLASLAMAGTDGTLRRRMEDGPAARLVRAKTGTLAEVSALSGYAAIDGRAPLAFSVLVNEVPDGAMSDARALQDDIAEALIAFLRAGG
jgi:D-alanyl-D-alanine carboxypeptidase/D-alanyl-D-alanine-endopeptidase (penicillin-binding protein 4)